MPASFTTDTSSSRPSSPASSYRCLDRATTNTTTPFSSITPWPVTPVEGACGESDSVVKAELGEELDQKLEAFLLEEEGIQPQTRSAADLPVEASAKITNLPEFECAFGFSGNVDEPDAIPETKAAFITAVKAEIEIIRGLQKGLQSYQAAINSRDYHSFSTDFLINQNTAVVISIDQLDQINAHLRQVQEEVETYTDDETVKKESLDALRQVQPWVMRTRAILRHCHVFYKINFVLASEKKSTGQ
ncbi:hypothetical protein H2200_001649 [Cladophialophora chaetospira]|uniref:Uncharacterized protein n=1 Tax=Cladophialophora chaetospira TaxID=386627 RepID=A0AA38XLB0_9EURO|nr:hypothetical protein H2200_001649 [Cladophialophora chaetospira]